MTQKSKSSSIRTYATIAVAATAIGLSAVNLEAAPRFNNAHGGGSDGGAVHRAMPRMESAPRGQSWGGRGSEFHGGNWNAPRQVFRGGYYNNWGPRPYYFNNYLGPRPFYNDYWGLRPVWGWPYYYQQPEVIYVQQQPSVTVVQQPSAYPAGQYGPQQDYQPTANAQGARNAGSVSAENSQLVQNIMKHNAELDARMSRLETAADTLLRKGGDEAKAKEAQAAASAESWTRTKYAIGGAAGVAALIGLGWLLGRGKGRSSASNPDDLQRGRMPPPSPAS